MRVVRRVREGTMHRRQRIEAVGVGVPGSPEGKSNDGQDERVPEGRYAAWFGWFDPELGQSLGCRIDGWRLRSNFNLLVFWHGYSLRESRK